MNIFSDFGIVDIVRVAPPFALAYVPYSSGGIGRPGESFAAIPRGDEALPASLGRPGEATTSSIGRAADQ